MKKSLRIWLAVLIVLGGPSWCYIHWLRPIIASFPNIGTVDDADQSQRLLQYVLSRVHFEGSSVIYPNKPPVYTTPFHNSAQLIVYGVTNTERQEEVLSAVREWHETNQVLSNIDVRFYERENWKTFTNAQAGTSGGNRLPENLLRKEFVK